MLRWFKRLFRRKQQPKKIAHISDNDLQTIVLILRSGSSYDVTCELKWLPNILHVAHEEGWEVHGPIHDYEQMRWFVMAKKDELRVRFYADL